MIGGLWKSAGSAALFAIAGFVVSGVGVPQARAADLGGDCCADLEARVAELEATTARKGNRRVSLTLSGQVSTALLFWDDGDESDVYVVDNTNTIGGSQFRFTGSAKINPNVTAGFELAVGLLAGARSAGGPGNGVSAEDDDGGAPGDSIFVVTYANWYLSHKQLGTLRVGRANTATAGVASINLGGTSVVANSSIGYWQRNFTDPESGQGWANILGGNTVNAPGLSRGNVINYTSPTVGGFNVAAAWGEDDLWDVALRYAGEFSGFRFAAGIGYANNTAGLGEFSDLPGGREISQIKGSASVLHVASGLFLTGAYVNQENDLAGSDDSTLYYVQGGITKNWTGLGNTAIYGEYARVQDALLDDDLNTPGTQLDAGFVADATVWGVGVVQHIDAAAMELFLSYRNFSAESDDEDFNDFQAVMSGARIRF